MDHVVTRIPLFPLRTVLCPGVALPLHIFEDRYLLLVDRCLRREQPFGVVLVREGPEVGPLRGDLAAVGTTASIRHAGDRADGRMDILAVGQQRFRLLALDRTSEPYLVGEVRFLEEDHGSRGEALRQAERVGRRFIRYLELLQPEDAEDGPEIEIEFELETEPAPDVPSGRGAPSGASDEGAPSDAPDSVEPLLAELEAAALSSEQRRELLMAAARRLTATDDPTALSYVLTALLQVDLDARQALLEVPDTLARLRSLDRLLERESWFLRQGLRPIIIDGSALRGRP
jgi:Lon protease-like protein